MQINIQMKSIDIQSQHYLKKREMFYHDMFHVSEHVINAETVILKQVSHFLGKIINAKWAWGDKAFWRQLAFMHLTHHYIVTVCTIWIEIWGYSLFLLTFSMINAQIHYVIFDKRVIMWFSTKESCDFRQKSHYVIFDKRVIMWFSTKES